MTCAYGEGGDVQQVPAEREDISRDAALAVCEVVSKSLDVSAEREVRPIDSALAERERRLRIMLHEGVRAIAITSLSGISGRIVSS